MFLRLIKFSYPYMILSWFSQSWNRFFWIWYKLYIFSAMIYWATCYVSNITRLVLNYTCHSCWHIFFIFSHFSFFYFGIVFIPNMVLLVSFLLPQTHQTKNFKSRGQIYCFMREKVLQLSYFRKWEKREYKFMVTKSEWL